MPTLLTVPFAEKDAAKALEANNVKLVLPTSAPKFTVIAAESPPSKAKRYEYKRDSKKIKS